ncbi:hypothetical protein ACFYKX_10435 [Cytobacillus sp. FJAT-54145]|uniref:DUF4926 domain-containing protein n=1 Tax=Cytobacillus spartinae TaxID=3299023 RepID=A0ABW6KBC8_9BACI
MDIQELKSLLKPGDLVTVQTPMFQGDGVVFAIFPKERFPIQLELTQPDGDGHAMKRVAWAEIKFWQPN